MSEIAVDCQPDRMSHAQGAFSPSFPVSKLDHRLPNAAAAFHASPGRRSFEYRTQTSDSNWPVQQQMSMDDNYSWGVYLKGDDQAPFPTLKWQFYKTKLCPWHARDSCFKGDACHFAHGEEDLRLSPNLQKTRMCIHFMKDKYCREGMRCNFAHGLQELRATSNFWKTKLCPLELRGKCLAGKSCRYAHSKDELRPLHRTSSGSSTNSGNSREFGDSYVNHSHRFSMSRGYSTTSSGSGGNMHHDDSANTHRHHNMSYHHHGRGMTYSGAPIQHMQSADGILSAPPSPGVSCCGAPGMESFSSTASTILPFDSPSLSSVASFGDQRSSYSPPMSPHLETMPMNNMNNMNNQMMPQTTMDVNTTATRQTNMVDNTGNQMSGELATCGVQNAEHQQQGMQQHWAASAIQQPPQPMPLQMSSQQQPLQLLPMASVTMPDGINPSCFVMTTPSGAVMLSPQRQATPTAATTTTPLVQTPLPSTPLQCIAAFPTTGHAGVTTTAPWITLAPQATGTAPAFPQQAILLQATTASTHTATPCNAIHQITPQQHTIDQVATQAPQAHWACNPTCVHQQQDTQAYVQQHESDQATSFTDCNQTQPTKVDETAGSHGEMGVVGREGISGTSTPSTATRNADDYAELSGADGSPEMSPMWTAAPENMEGSHVGVEQHCDELSTIGGTECQGIVYGDSVDDGNDVVGEERKVLPMLTVMSTSVLNLPCVSAEELIAAMPDRYED